MERTKEGTIPQKLLIFCQKKITVDELEAKLDDDQDLEQKIKFSAQGIHGDKDQRTRHTVLRRFKEPLASKQTRIMIATDVASRGLDVRDIGIVVNYDMPQNTEDYVHRIGRTGRAGDKGLAIGFVTTEDRSIARGLVHVLERCDQTAPQELFDLIDECAPKRRPRKAKREDGDGEREERQPREKKESNTLFVGNLGFRTSEETIMEFFAGATEVRIAQGDDGRPRGYAHVDFATAEEAQEALKLSGQNLDGRDIRCDMQGGGGGGGGYEGGHASKSRSNHGIWDTRPASTTKMADRRTAKYDSKMRS